MLHDLGLLLWLRARHVRTFLLRLAHFAGSDPSVERGVLDRAYQLYAFAAFAVCVALIWFLLLDTVEEACAALGPEFVAAAVPLVLLVPLVAFLYVTVRGLRGSALRLSRPDIAYVAASALSSRAIVADAACALALTAAVSGGVVGYVVGVGLLAGLGAFAAPGAVALAMAALCTATACGAQAAGVARLAAPACRRGRATVAGAAVAGVLAAALAVAAFALAPALVLDGAPGFAALAAAALALLVAVAGILAALAPRVDMTAVTEQSALSAELDPFSPFSPLDPNVQRDYRRRVKVARRRPRFHLPAASGRGALAARAALSIVRQREGLLSLVMLGACVTPLGVAGLLGQGVPLTLLFWLMLLVAAQPLPVREATRTFRDDIRVRLVRDQLPFGTLELLALGSLPAFALVTLLTCAAVPFMLPAGASLAAALVLGVLANAAALLSAGLGAVRLYPGGPRPWSEGGLAVFALAVGLVSFFGQPWLTVVVAALVCIVVAAVVRVGAECG